MNPSRTAVASARWGRALALAWACTAAPGMAAVVTQTASASRSSSLMSVTPLGTNSVVFFTEASAQTLVFGGFDNALGTLVGVQIDYTYQFDYQVSTAAYNPVPSMYTFYKLTQNLSAPGIGSMLSFCGASEECQEYAMSGRNAFVVDIFKGTSPLYTQSAVVAIGSLQAYASGPVSIVLGDPGSLDFLILPGIYNPQFIDNSLRVDTAVTATLTYSYAIPSQVPEAGTSALMAGGAAWLALVLRRTRRAGLRRSRPIPR